MTVREITFVCIWSTPDAEHRVLVRAWSEREARALLGDELRASDVDVPDDVRIVELARSSPAPSRELAGDDAGASQ